MREGSRGTYTTAGTLTLVGVGNVMMSTFHSRLLQWQRAPSFQTPSFKRSSTQKREMTNQQQSFLVCFNKRAWLQGGGGENSRRTRMRMRRRTKMPGVFVNVVGLVWFRLNCCCVLLPHHPKVSNEKSVQQGMEGRMSQTKKKSFVGVISHCIAQRHHLTLANRCAVLCKNSKVNSPTKNHQQQTENQPPRVCVCAFRLLAFGFLFARAAQPA